MAMNVFVETVMGNMEARETQGVLAHALVIVQRCVAVLGLIVYIQRVCFLVKYDTCTSPKSVLCHTRVVQKVLS